MVVYTTDSYVLCYLFTSRSWAILFYHHPKYSWAMNYRNCCTTFHFHQGGHLRTYETALTTTMHVLTLQPQHACIMMIYQLQIFTVWIYHSVSDSRTTMTLLPALVLLQGFVFQFSAVWDTPCPKLKKWLRWKITVANVCKLGIETKSN